MERTRRAVLTTSPIIVAHGRIAAASRMPAAVAPAFADVVGIDPAPLFPISPYLYMQFMEPLGVTDSAVEAAWDHDADGWRHDFVEAVQDLAPGAIRWGGLLS